MDLIRSPTSPWFVQAYSVQGNIILFLTESIRPSAPVEAHIDSTKLRPA